MQKSEETSWNFNLHFFWEKNFLCVLIFLFFFVEFSNLCHMSNWICGLQQNVIQIQHILCTYVWYARMYEQLVYLTVDVDLVLLARTASRCRRAYILPLFFSFFVFNALSLRSLNESQPNLNIYLLMIAISKNLVWTPLSIYPHMLGGQKPLLWDRLSTLTKHISATEHDINNRKETCQSMGTRLRAPKFGELWSRNGWERLANFCALVNFFTGRHCQTYGMDVI